MSQPGDKLKNLALMRGFGDQINERKRKIVDPNIWFVSGCSKLSMSSMCLINLHCRSHKLFRL